MDINDKKYNFIYLLNENMKLTNNDWTNNCLNRGKKYIHKN